MLASKRFVRTFGVGRSSRISSVRVQCHSRDQTAGRRAIIGGGLATSVGMAVGGKALAEDARTGKVAHTEEEWKQLLSTDAYRVLRQAATEPRWSSPLNNEKRPGTFVCAGCGSPLFKNSAKYNSGTGWPSFYEAIDGAVDEQMDYSIPFMPRVEVRCRTCQGHLGHVFDDGPPPTGMRYCMNGVAMDFQPDDPQARTPQG